MLHKLSKCHTDQKMNNLENLFKLSDRLVHNNIILFFFFANIK